MSFARSLGGSTAIQKHGPKVQSSVRARRVVWAVAAGSTSGLLFTLALPPLHLAAVAWVALIPLFLVVRLGDVHEVIAAAYAGGLVIIGQVAYGLWHYDPSVWWLAVLALPLWFVLPAALVWWAELQRPTGFHVLVAPVVWVALEVLAQELLYLPLDTGMTLVRSVAPLQVAAVAGSSGLAFLVVLCGVLGAQALDRWRQEGVRSAAPTLILTLLIPTVTTGAGWLVLTDNRATNCVTRAEIIQPAIPFATGEQSWVDPDTRRAVRATFWQQLAALPHTPGSLVVWPEGAGAFESFRLGSARKRLQHYARLHQSHLFISAADFDEHGRKFNSIFTVDPQRRLAKYDKLTPVPGAESDVTPGRGLGLISTEHGTAGMLICFESCFPRFARSLAANGATFLSVSTSDVAFGRSNLPELHLSTTIARAVETRRSVVYASNGGPSAFIDPYGRVSARSPLLARTVLEGCVPPSPGESLFTRGGYLLRWVSVLLAGSMLCVRRRRRRQRPTRQPVPVLATVLAVLASAFIAVALVPLNAWVVSWEVEAAPPLRMNVSLPLAKASGTAFRQTAPNTCGATAIAYLASFYGVSVDAEALAARIPLTDVGASMADLAAEAERVGFVVEGVRDNLAALRSEEPPVIVHLNPSHFAVVLAIQGNEVMLYDPSAGLGTVPVPAFQRRWSGKVLRVRPPPTEFDAAPTFVTAAR